MSKEIVLIVVLFWELSNFQNKKLGSERTYLGSERTYLGSERTYLGSEHTFNIFGPLENIEPSCVQDRISLISNDTLKCFTCFIF